MKGYKFYLEYPTAKDKNKGTRKELGNHSGNCIAVIDNQYKIINDEIFVESIHAQLWCKNSPVSGGMIQDKYLHDLCKRISEKQAKEIHPELFNSL